VVKKGDSKQTSKKKKKKRGSTRKKGGVRLGADKRRGGSRLIVFKKGGGRGENSSVCQRMSRKCLFHDSRKEGQERSSSKKEKQSPWKGEMGQVQTGEIARHRIPKENAFGSTGSCRMDSKKEHSEQCRPLGRSWVGLSRTPREYGSGWGGRVARKRLSPGIQGKGPPPGLKLGQRLPRRG